MKRLPILTLVLAMAAANPPVLAQEHAHAGHAAAATHDLTEGEVKKIDREAGKITMRHGEIRNLNMAAMTMVLRVQDAAMLERVDVGDKVRFAAERINGAITIVQMEKLQ